VWLDFPKLSLETTTTAMEFLPSLSQCYHSTEKRLTDVLLFTNAAFLHYRTTVFMSFDITLTFRCFDSNLL